MENHKLVMPSDLNHHGYLFGGKMLSWVDEYAWMAASLEYRPCHFVTIGMDKVEFRKPVRQGDILRFSITRHGQVHKTSVKYLVVVYIGEVDVFSTIVTFVNVDQMGKKRRIKEDTEQPLNSR